MPIFRLLTATLVAVAIATLATHGVLSAQTRPTAPVLGPAGQIVGDSQAAEASSRRLAALLADADGPYVIAAYPFGVVIPLGNLFAGDSIAFEFSAFDWDTFNDCSVQITVVIAAANSSSRLQRKVYNFNGAGRLTVRSARRGDGVMFVQTTSSLQACAVVTDFEVST